MTTDAQIEAEIQVKGLNAPRVTPQRIQAVIARETYHKLSETLMVCVLHLRNGFTVTGQSACASVDNFDHQLGMKIARQDAEQKIWPLEGYLLREKLYNEEVLKAQTE